MFGLPGRPVDRLPRGEEVLDLLLIVVTSCRPGRIAQDHEDLLLGLDALGCRGLFDQTGYKERQEATVVGSGDRVPQRIRQVDLGAFVLEPHVMVSGEESEFHVRDRVRGREKLEAEEVWEHLVLKHGSYGPRAQNRRHFVDGLLRGRQQERAGPERRVEQPNILVG